MPRGAFRPGHHAVNEDVKYRYMITMHGLADFLAITRIMKWKWITNLRSQLKKPKTAVSYSLVLLKPPDAISMALLGKEDEALGTLVSTCPNTGWDAQLKHIENHTKFSVMSKASSKSICRALHFYNALQLMKATTLFFMM